ncbi:hypothetical protein AAZX31_03G005300 [Glycine max]
MSPSTSVPNHDSPLFLRQEKQKPQPTKLIAANDGHNDNTVDVDGRIVLLFVARLKGVIRVLEGTIFKYAEVQEILERRGKGENLEYLVWWKDSGASKWVTAKFVALSIENERDSENTESHEKE